MTAALIAFLSLAFVVAPTEQDAGKKRPRDLGVVVGSLPTGPNNAITDVPGVLVGQFTLDVGENGHTGATAILPHGGNLNQDKVPAAIYVGNGFGKLMGVTQVRELGEIETPIILTNTLNVRCCQAVREREHEHLRSKRTALARRLWSTMARGLRVRACREGRSDAEPRRPRGRGHGRRSAVDGDLRLRDGGL